MRFNKAAMFGLDARIALAIFGALSVISGAALYSAIQQSKVTATITEMQELAKALESYYIDTGSVPQYSGLAVKIQALLENTESSSNWNGPYISLPKHSTTPEYRLGNSSYDNYLIYLVTNAATWGGTQSVDLVAPVACTDAIRPCSYWIISEFMPISIAEAIDLQIDGEVNYKSGNLRIRRYTTGTATIYLKGMKEIN